MKERPILFSGEMVRAILDGRKTQTRRLAKGVVEVIDGAPVGGRGKGTLPLGDRLWVRETLAQDDGGTWRYAADRAVINLPEDDDANGVACDWLERKRGTVNVSIHMPRWASRLTLEITALRVERLQRITPDDVRAEGVAGWTQGTAFERLWDSINGDRAPWASNPWVWAISFRKLP